MKILSININNLAGNTSERKPLLKDYKECSFYKILSKWGKDVDFWRNEYHENLIENANKLLSYIKKVNPDIIVFQEYDYTSKPSKFLGSCLKDLSYIEVLPDAGNIKSTRGRKSITLMFIKDRDIVSYSNTGKIENNLRWVKVEIGDTLIAGVHFPLGGDFEDYWEELKRVYLKYKHRKLVVIGDFNVYAENTPRRVLLDELLSLGLKDLWLSLGNPNDTVTHLKSRLDYAFVTDKVFSLNPKASIDNNPVKEGFSDHSALIVEI